MSSSIDSKNHSFNYTKIEDDKSTCDQSKYQYEYLAFKNFELRPSVRQAFFVYVERCRKALRKKLSNRSSEFRYEKYKKFVEILVDWV